MTDTPYEREKNRTTAGPTPQQQEEAAARATEIEARKAAEKAEADARALLFSRRFNEFLSALRKHEQRIAPDGYRITATEPNIEVGYPALSRDSTVYQEVKVKIEVGVDSYAVSTWKKHDWKPVMFTEISPAVDEALAELGKHAVKAAESSRGVRGFLQRTKDIDLAALVLVVALPLSVFLVFQLVQWVTR